MSERESEPVTEKKSINIFTVLRDNFRSLEPEDRKLVNTYLLIWAILLALSLWLFNLPETSMIPHLAKALDGLVLALFVSITFALIDRLNLLTPIEHQLKSSVRRLESDMADLVKLLKEDSATFRTHASNLAGYSKYAVARQDFGFTNIRGIVKAEDSLDDFETENLIRFALEKTPDGGTLRYMTSFISETPAFMSYVKDAMKRHVKVQLMLMMPTADTEVVRARFNDCYVKDQYSAVEDFAAMAKLRAKNILHEMKILRDRAKVHHGSFDVEFYTENLNFPLIISSPETGSHLDPISYEFAFTGFYAGKNAEQMPYIEWRSGDFKIIEDFKELFDAKWTACAHLKEIKE